MTFGMGSGGTSIGKVTRASPVLLAWGGSIRLMPAAGLAALMSFDFSKNLWMARIP